MKITLTYDVSLGNGQVSIVHPKRLVDPQDFKELSFQAIGDGAVNEAVTCKIQESNLSTSQFTDLAGGSIVVNTSTDEYKSVGEYLSALLQIDIAVGTATAGIITFILTFKR